MTRSGTLILKGKWPVIKRDTLILKGKWPVIKRDLHMIIRAEELAHSRVSREPFSIHPEVAERMEATNAHNNS